MKKLTLLGSIITCFASWLFFNWTVLLSLHQRWWTFGETYEIGYPVVGVALWWAFTERSYLIRVGARPSALGMLFFSCALALSTLGRLVQIQVIQQLMMPMSLWCGLFAVAGWPWARRLLLPCVLLLAGVPIWDFLVDPLRILTIWAVHGLLSVSNITAIIENFQIVMPSGVMVVAGGCSGLNLLLAALVLGLVHAGMNIRGKVLRMSVVLLAAIIGVVDNWIRVFALVSIGYYSNMQSRLVHNHADFGWYLFAASLVVFFWLIRRIESKEVVQAPDKSELMWVDYSVSIVRRSCAISLILLCLTVGVKRLEARSGTMINGFAAPTNATLTPSSWLPHYSGYDLAQSWQLVKNGRIYNLVALTYLQQARDKKLMYFSNSIAEAAQTHAESRLDIDSGETINSSVIYDNGWHLVLWYYWIDGEITSSALKARILQAKAILLSDPSSALVAISISCQRELCKDEIDRSEMQKVAAEVQGLQKAKL